MGVKLVRDRIRSLPGFVPCSSDRFRYVVSLEEHAALLLQKIAEEFGELLLAQELGDPHEINAEGCDLLEAVEAFINIRTGLGSEGIRMRINSKQMERGGFKAGLVWEHP